MAVSPVLYAPRVKLVPFSEEFLTNKYVAWLNDPEVVRYSEQRHRHHSIESCAQYLKSFDGSPNYFWAVVSSDPILGHIGNLGATVDPHNLVADLAILIGERTVWGKGFGLEAWKTACDYLLSKEGAGLRKVTAGTMSCNQGMLKIMNRSGMAPDGIRKRQFLKDGEQVDLVMQALFSEY